MLSGALLYVLPPGLIKVGRNRPEVSGRNPVDIMLDGPLVGELHWLVMETVYVHVFDT